MTSTPSSKRRTLLRPAWHHALTAAVTIGVLVTSHALAGPALTVIGVLAAVGLAVSLAGLLGDTLEPLRRGPRWDALLVTASAVATVLACAGCILARPDTGAAAGAVEGLITSTVMFTGVAAITERRTRHEPSVSHVIDLPLLPAPLARLLRARRRPVITLAATIDPNERFGIWGYGLRGVGVTAAGRWFYAGVNSMLVPPSRADLVTGHRERVRELVGISIKQRREIQQLKTRLARADAELATRSKAVTVPVIIDGTQVQSAIDKALAPLMGNLNKHAGLGTVRTPIGTITVGTMTLGATLGAQR